MTAPVAKTTAAPTQPAFTIKTEPGLKASEKEATSRVQPQDLSLNDDFMDDSADKTWEAFNAARPDSPTAQQPSPREAPAQREQLPERQLGQKDKHAKTELQRFGPDMIEVFKRADEKKRAKTELVAAQLKYSEACIAVEELRERTMAIFDAVNRSEHPGASPQ